MERGGKWMWGAREAWRRAVGDVPAIVDLSNRPPAKGIMDGAGVKDTRHLRRTEMLKMDAGGWEIEDQGGGGLGEEVGIMDAGELSAGRFREVQYVAEKRKRAESNFHKQNILISRLRYGGHRELLAGWRYVGEVLYHVTQPLTSFRGTRLGDTVVVKQESRKLNTSKTRDAKQKQT